MKKQYGPALARLFGLGPYASYKKLSLGYGRRLIFGTLTWGRVPKDSLGSEVKALLKRGRKFLKKKYKGHLITAEQTEKKEDGEYYIHLHFLAYGDYQNQQLLQSEWGRYLWVTDAQRDPKTGALTRTSAQSIIVALNYILKYVSKGAAAANEDLPQLHRIRYVSAGGVFDRIEKPKYRSYCKHCFEKYGKKHYVNYATENDVDAIMRQHLGEGWINATDQEGNFIGEAKEPLVVLEEISWPSKVPEQVSKELKLYYERLKERWERWYADKWIGIWLNWLQFGSVN